jgi:hypothetical protein
MDQGKIIFIGFQSLPEPSDAMKAKGLKARPLYELWTVEDLDRTTLTVARALGETVRSKVDEWRARYQQ